MTNKKLLEKLKEDMEMRGFSHYTKDSYYRKAKEIIEYFGKPMKQVTTANPSDTYFSAITPTYKTVDSSTSTIEFKKLKAGVTKIRVYMWVEGQDVDCENGASGSDIKFDLQFTATAP